MTVSITNDQEKYKICEVEGCERSVYRRNYCGPHYRRFRRYGTPTATGLYAKPGGACLFEGCERPSKYKNMCNPHYEQVRRLGSIEKVKQREEQKRRQRQATEQTRQKLIAEKQTPCTWGDNPDDGRMKCAEPVMMLDDGETPDIYCFPHRRLANKYYARRVEERQAKRDEIARRREYLRNLAIGKPEIMPAKRPRFVVRWPLFRPVDFESFKDQCQAELRDLLKDRRLKPTGQLVELWMDSDNYIWASVEAQPASYTVDQENFYRYLGLGYDTLTGDLK